MEHSEVAAAAVRPSAALLLETRALILASLDGKESLSFNEFVSGVLRAHDVPLHNQGSVHFEGSYDSVAAIDATHPIIQHQRIEFAVRDVVAQLASEGVLLLVDSHGNDPAQGSIPIANSSGTSSVRYQHHYAPLPAGTRWGTAEAPAHRVELARISLTGEVPELLGSRGVQVLHQAIQCFHRGLFIAATDLLGAASESAWFNLAALVTDDVQLPALVQAGTNAAKVIDRTAESIQRTRAWNGQQLLDLRAQAAHLRDLRNYGLHPVGERDDDREPAFGEAGCAVLFMAAPRYFRQLEQIRQVLAARVKVGASTATQTTEGQA